MKASSQHNTMPALSPEKNGTIIQGEIDCIEIVSRCQQYKRTYVFM